MFDELEKFNTDVSSWDTSSVKYMAVSTVSSKQSFIIEHIHYLFWCLPFFDAYTCLNLFTFSPCLRMPKNSTVTYPAGIHLA